MEKPVVPVFGSAVGEDELAAVADVIDRQWLGMGPRVEEFEAAFAARIGLPNFVMLDSGSNALYAAVHILKSQSLMGTEVILPSFTWVACAHAVHLAGLTPVFCDVEPHTGNVSRRTIEPHITPRTGAIMVVHYAGLPVDLAPILNLGFPVIEDAAHAVDSTYEGRPCGSLGDVGIFSFDAVKNLTAGSGGGLTAQSPTISMGVRELRYCGIGGSGHRASSQGKSRWWETPITEPFLKLIPSDLNAAIGLAQLKRLPELQRVREERWRDFDEFLAEFPWVERPPGAPGTLPVGTKHSYFTYLVNVPERDALAEYLLKHDVYTTLRFHPLHLSPPYKSDVSLPNTERFGRTGLNLPLHPRLTREDIRTVCDRIGDFGAAHGF